MRYLICLFCFLSYFSFSQELSNQNIQFDEFPAEKVYVSTDRDVYFDGEDLWFSVFLTDPAFQPSDISSIVYVELINEATDEIVDKRSISVENGFADGDFTLPTFQDENDYVLRAYTKYLLNFSPETFFHKDIQVVSHDDLYSEDPKTIRRKSLADNFEANGKLNLKFYTESGDLLHNYSNILAFKAVDQNGEFVRVNGKIVNTSGEEISKFETSELGLGRIFIYPDLDQYNAVVNYDGKEYKFELPEVKSTGNRMQVREFSGMKIGVDVVSNDDQKATKLLGFQNGQLVIAEEVEGETYQTVFDVKQLNEGLLQFILTDKNLNILSERPYFIYKDKNQVEVSLKGRVAKKAEQLAKFSPSESGKVIKGNFSVKVVDKRFIPSNFSTLPSFMLFASDLMGTINRPSYYLDPSIPLKERKEAMDLLLLTHEKLRYLQENDEETILVPEKDGFTVQVKLREYKQYSNDGEPVQANVELTALNPLISTELLTKENGVGVFTGLNLTDSTALFLKANYGESFKIKKNKVKTKTDPIHIERIDADAPRLSSYYNKEIDWTEMDSLITSLKGEFSTDLRLKAAYNDIVLEPITVSAEKPEDPRFENRGEIYSNPSNRVLREDLGIPNALSVVDFLRRVPGVTVMGAGMNARVTIRGLSSIMSSNTPLYLVDGMPVDQQFALSMTGFDIDYVDVLKGPRAAIYGSRGGNGVIAIYTRRYDDYEQYDDELEGQMTFMLPGYYEAREFENPTLLPSSDPRKKPYVPTVYWSSVDELNQIEFETPDYTGDFQLIVEGITSDGLPVYESYDFSVVE